jgi:hypothetical protein
VDEASIDDSLALNEALECAASRRHATTLLFPPGRYVLRTPLRPRSSHLMLSGSLSEDGSPRATLVADPCNPTQLPGAIQVSDVPVDGLTVRALRIELEDGPRLPPGDPRATSNSGLQLNRCSGCVVEHVDMEYTGGDAPECKPYDLDGITFAMGSFGVVRRVRVSGVPKVGIYAASAAAAGPLLVEDSEVRRCDGPLGATGIGILASDVTLRSVSSHDNVRHPFPRRPGAAAEEGNGLLVLTPPGGPSSPARIRVERSRFDDNGGAGALIGSLSPSFPPTDVTLEDVRARRNGVHGIRVEAGARIVLSRVEAAGNGDQGIFVTAETVLPVDRLARIGEVLIRDPIVHDNGVAPRLRADPRHPRIVPGIGIRLAEHVTVLGGRFYRSEGSTSLQYFGVGRYVAGDGAPVDPPAGVAPPGARVDFLVAHP